MTWSPKRRSKRLDAVVDEFVESYVCWREACEDVRAAYQRWATTSPPQRTLAYDWYRAALDREEDAARVHSKLAARLRRRPQAEHR